MLPSWPRTWVPLASTYELDPTRPNKVPFAGKNYACWKGNDKWHVVLDACPHRLAPLSEGRVDEKGLLQCAYHGWSFDGNGACKNIPQMKGKLFTKCNVASFPTQVYNKILWIMPWDGLDEAKTPREIMYELDVCATFTREFPFDWAALVENVIDPSHVPFAHHGLQGNRADAVPIDVLSTQHNADGFVIETKDRTMGKDRIGKTHFYGPYLVRYSSRFIDSRSFNVTLFCLPSSIGRARAILLTTKPSKQDDTFLHRLSRKIPIWITHSFANRFLETDLLLLHGQDENLLNGHSYKMPAKCDVSTTMFNAYLKKIGYQRDSVKPFLSRKQLLHRFDAHTTNCVHCTRAHNRFVKTQQVCVALALFFSFTANVAKAVMFLVAFISIEGIKKQFVHVDFRYE